MLIFGAMHFISEIRYNPETGCEQKYYRINASLSLLVARTIYCASELKSLRIMKENSAACELVYGRQGVLPGYRSTYQVAPDLYKIKEKLERHLCNKTDAKTDLLEKSKFVVHSRIFKK